MLGGTLYKSTNQWENGIYAGSRRTMFDNTSFVARPCELEKCWSKPVHGPRKITSFLTSSEVNHIIFLNMFHIAKKIMTTFNASAFSPLKKSPLNQWHDMAPSQGLIGICFRLLHGQAHFTGKDHHHGHQAAWREPQVASLKAWGAEKES